LSRLAAAPAVRPPTALSSASLLCVDVHGVSELHEHGLCAGAGGAEAPVVSKSVPPAASACTEGVEPNEGPVAPRVRLPMQNRELGDHEYLLGVEIRPT
jgi:hypothetical protein